MRPNFSLSRLALLTAALVCVSPLVSAATEPLASAAAPAGQLAFAIAPAAGKTLQEVHDAVVSAAAGRGWTIKDNAPDRVVLYHLRHGYEATVTLLVTPARITAYCEGYAVTRKGVRKHPQQPKNWLNYLRDDISRMVSGVPVN